jgi:hypothetical protein
MDIQHDTNAAPTEATGTTLISHDKATKRIKYGGRTKGTPNRITTELRLILAETLSKEIARLPQMLEQLPPHSRLHYLFKLSRLVMPEPHPQWDMFSKVSQSWDYEEWTIEEKG